MNPVLLRAILALGLLVLGAGLYLLINRLVLYRAGRNHQLLGKFKPGKPAILYFTMEGCVPCRTTQRPALEYLLAWVGEQVQFLEVDVVDQPQMADRWGVLSVPTTFVIDSQGRPRRVNHGVALAEKLLDQLEQISSRPLVKRQAKENVEFQVTTTGMD